MSSLATETFGDLSSYNTIIGLTGLRGVGKSTVAGMLVRRGFIRVHAFDGGKAATLGYFRHLGADEGTAGRMVYGDLRDVSSSLLPGCATPRYFMERFGRFMGSDMGCEWTLGAELDRVARLHPGEPVVVESVVYESELLRARGGIVVRVVRDGHGGPAGMETDNVQAMIQEDALIDNCGTLADLEEAVSALLVSA